MTRAALTVMAVVIGMGLPASALAQGTPAPGTAQDEPVDTILLRNAGLYRGRIREIVPDDHVTIAVEKGDTKRIPWAEIDRIILGSAGAPDGTTWPSSQTSIATSEEAPEMIGPLVHVRLTSTRTVSLYRKPVNTNTWFHACFSPCDLELPVGDRYRVQGTSVNPSAEFRLAAERPSTVVSVDASSFVGSLAGGVIATSGALTSFIGLLLLTSKDTRAGGGIAFLVGVAVGLGGFYIYKTSSKTEVSQSAPARTSFVREPSWTGPSTERDTMTRGASFPILFQRAF